MTCDPARATLGYARTDAEGRVASATSAMVRVVCGGMPWGHELVRRHRADLERGLMDLAIIKLAIAELDVIDGKTPQ